MSPTSDHQVTALLNDWNAGDPEALRKLLPRVYDELHVQAVKAFRGEVAGHTLQPTALVHEVYVRLAGEEAVAWQNRAHFFGATARLIRRILVDHARERRAAKRGGGAPKIALDEAVGLAVLPEIDLLVLDEALSDLAALDERQSRIVELRFFTGLTIAEVARVLDVGTATVEREWRTAKAWLLHQVRDR